MKTYEGQYTDWDGEVGDREYTLHVRDFDRGVATHVNPAGELMWEKDCTLVADRGKDLGCGSFALIKCLNSFQI